LILAMVGFVCALGCEEGAELAVRPDSDYLPLRKGRFWIYQIDSTVFVANAQRRFQYQIQVEVTDSITERSGHVWYVLSRSRRANSASSFSPLLTWSARQTSQESLVRHGNTAYVALSFPIFVGRQWNGNAFNTLGGDEFCEGTGPCDFYAYAEVGGTRQVGATLHSDVVTVEEEYTPDRLVKFDVRKSWYARGVGLIERQYTVLNYCTLPACFGRQSVDSGLAFSQQLISYGDR
jgi:hypothetical protein